MRIVSLSAVVACLVLFFTLQPAAGSENWKLEKEKNGISTYSSKVEGSTYKAFKAVTTVNASMASVGDVLRDVDEYPLWMDKVTETKILKKYNANDMDVYIVMNFPWPTTDRDAVASARTTIDPGTGNVTVTTELIENSDVAPKDKLVRLPKMFQQFILVYKEFDQTEVTYSLHMETGGSLKAILVDGQTQKSPHKSLENLKEFVKKDKYRKSDPLDPVNIDTARTIISAIAKKNYKDQDIIDILTTDKELMKISIRAGYSDAGVMEIANALLQKYVRTEMFAKKIKGQKDEELLAMMAKDEKLSEKFLNDEELLKKLISEGEINTQVLDAIAALIK